MVPPPVQWAASFLMLREPGWIGAWSPEGRGPTGVLVQSQQGKEAELGGGQDLLRSI